MITLIVKLSTYVGSAQAFIEATKKAQALAQQEEGCLAYEFYREGQQMSAFVLIEKYKDSEALEIHKKQDHFLEWKLRTTPMMLGVNAKEVIVCNEL